MGKYTCICVVLFLCTAFLALGAGCLTSTSSSGDSSRSDGITIQGTASGDAGFLSLYGSSQEDLAARMGLMNSYFPVGAATRGVPYLASELRSSALGVSDAADAYHATMIRMESFETKENELQRNDYLKYLSAIRKAGADVAEAAKAEMNGEYGLAQNYAESARDALKDPEGIPNDAHRSLLRAITVSLDDYIQKMREKRV